MDSGHLIIKWVVKNMSVMVILILLFSEVKKNAYVLITDSRYSIVFSSFCVDLMLFLSNMRSDTVRSQVLDSDRMVVRSLYQLPPGGTP